MEPCIKKVFGSQSQEIQPLETEIFLMQESLGVLPEVYLEVYLAEAESVENN